MSGIEDLKKNIDMLFQDLMSIWINTKTPSLEIYIILKKNICLGKNIGNCLKLNKYEKFYSFISCVQQIKRY